MIKPNKLTTIKSLLSATLLLSITASTMLARDISQKEYEIYAAENYKADFSKLSDSDKEKLKQEYKEKIELAIIIRKRMYEDPIYQAALDFKALDLWTRQIAANSKPTDKELQDMYSKSNMTVAPKYKLRNILVKDDKEADDIVKTLSSLSGDKLESKFISLVKDKSIDPATKDKDGDGGWVDISVMPKEIIDIIKDKTKDSIVKLPSIKDVGIQIILIEDMAHEHKASFEEAKNTLTQMAISSAISKEAQALLLGSNKDESKKKHKKNK